MQDLKRIRYWSLLQLLCLSLAMVLVSIGEAAAQRRGGGGGGGARQSIGARGGGGSGAARAAPRSGGQQMARGGQAVQRGGGQARGAAGTRDVGAGAANRSGNVGSGNRQVGDRQVGGGNRERGDVASGNRIDNSNRNNNINVDNDINIDADGGWDNDWDYHPIAAGVAFGTAAAVTSAAIGSMYYSLPPSCVPRPYNSISYYYCGGAWYQPAYSGTSVSYTVVNAPY